MMSYYRLWSLFWLKRNGHHMAVLTYTAWLGICLLVDVGMQEIITKVLQDSISECILYSVSMLGAGKYTHTYKPRTVIMQWMADYIYVVFVDMESLCNAVNKWWYMASVLVFTFGASLVACLHARNSILELEILCRRIQWTRIHLHVFTKN